MWPLIDLLKNTRFSVTSPSTEEISPSLWETGR